MTGCKRTYQSGCMVVNVVRPEGGIAIRILPICPVNVNKYLLLGVGDGSILGTSNDDLLAVTRE